MALPVTLPQDGTYCLLGDACALCWQGRADLTPLTASQWRRILVKSKRGEDH